MTYNSGIKIIKITLHVGLGTFRPVSVENVEEHLMHSEYYEVSQQAADTINETRKNGGRIINSDYKELLEEFSKKIKGSSARRVVEIAAKVKSEINSSMKYDLWITNMLINCWEEIHGTGNRS